MPNYPWLQETAVADASTMQAHMQGLRTIGVPYSDADLSVDYIQPMLEGKTEEDALVAYLQVLGTMVKLDDSKVYRE